jgi:hypothetical protein
MQKFICLCIAVAVLAVGNVGVAQQAQGRWKPEYANSPNREWFAQQQNKHGYDCCDYADTHAVYDAYIKQGKWYVPIDGTVHEIQSYQVLDGSNPTGHAVIWYIKYELLGLYPVVDIFCFAPGPMY